MECFTAKWTFQWLMNNKNIKPHSQPSAQRFPFYVTGAQVCRGCQGGNEYHNVCTRRSNQGKKKQNTSASAKVKYTEIIKSIC